MEGLLLLLLLSLGAEKRLGKNDDSISVVDLQAPELVEEAPESSAPEPARQADEQPVATEDPPPSQPAQPSIAKPAEAQPVPQARPVLPTPNDRPALIDIPRNVLPAAPAPAPSPGPAPAPARKRVYGPPNTGGSSAFRDSERVGTAPNGEPLYAAAWYREPRPDQLRGYLSSARGPGWGLIACRTVPDYRVEDCVGLDEYPQGSQITRAVLAAAWEFRVRPARLGGIPQVGSWVRIRIDYSLERR